MSRVRHSIQQLQQWYDDGNKEPLEKLVRAWRGIQGKNWDDDDGFFIIGGFHGEPFHGAGIRDSNNWWGGYCNHANVLFPTWHRAYVLRLEDALRTVKDCEDVTMAFWDEYAYYNPFSPVPPGPPGPPGAPGLQPKPDPVIPAVLTSPTFPLDGNDVPNPFYSYTFLKGLTDAIDDKHRYDKPAGYTTVRYPLSGLVGTEADAKATKVYNSQFKDNAAILLNDNVRAWLNPGANIPDRGGGERIPDFTSIGRRLELCMDAPNYMLFSNTTSAGKYTADYGGEDKHYVVSLESPHNAMHLAVGGFFQSGQYNANPLPGLNANGDMGENNTASLDPIFWFHHTFIDYCFWTWQNRWGLTQKGSLSVEWGYPGTNSSDYPSVPSAQTQANIQLNMDSPLYPFKKADKTWYTSHDVTDITDLGYSYGPGTMDKFKHKGGFFDAPPATKLGSLLKVTGINRLDYKGSFVVRTYAQLEDGTRYEVGRDEILSRWNVSGCQNCQNHLGVRSFAPIHPEVQLLLDKAKGHVGYVVEVSHHGSDTPEVVEGAIVRPLKKAHQ